MSQYPKYSIVIPAFNESARIPATLESVIASVRANAWDAEIIVSATTGQHALGVLGTKDFELITSTMTRTTDGWKLSDQAVGVGKCHRA